MNLRCKMCAAELHPDAGSVSCACESCGSRQTIMTPGNEDRTMMFNRANRLRRVGAFQKSAEIFLDLRRKYPQEAEAVWGLVLCRYEVAYQDHPETGRKVPVCGRGDKGSILLDQDYASLLKLAKPEAAALYRAEAKEMANGQAGTDEKKIREAAEKAIRAGEFILARDLYDTLLSPDEADAETWLNSLMADCGVRTLDELGRKPGIPPEFRQKWIRAAELAEGDLGLKLERIGEKWRKSEEINRLVYVLEIIARKKQKPDALRLMRKIYRYLADAKLNKSHLATSALAELKQMGGEYAARADQISQRWNIIAAIGKAMAEGRTFDDVIVSRVRKMNVRGSSDAIVRAELTAMHAIGVLKRIDGNYTMTEPGTEGKKVPVGKNSQAPERNLAKEYREACRRAEGIIQREIRDRTDRIEQKYEEKYGILWKEMAQSRSAGDAGALKELEAKALTLKRDKENELFQMEKEVRARHTLPPLAEWKG